MAFGAIFALVFICLAAVAIAVKAVWLLVQDMRREWKTHSTKTQTGQAFWSDRR